MAFTGQFQIENLWPGLRGQTLGTNLTIDLSGSTLTLPTSQSLTSPVFATGLTASGSAANDFSGSTGAFKTSTGAVTLGGSTTLAAGKNFTAAAGAENFDFSASTGTFKFPTGAATGQLYTVLNNQGAGPTTLTAAQSGAYVLFDRAAGNAYVLPAPVIGLEFTFIVTVSVTSNAHEVVTDAGTTFLIGEVDMLVDAAATTLAVSGNGTTHVEFTGDGAHQGGLIGSQVTFTCVSSTLWNVSGFWVGTAALSTPFTT